MYEFILLCRGRPTLTREEYTATLLKGCTYAASADEPQPRRYEVNVVESVPPGEEAIDAAILAGFDSPEGIRPLLRHLGELSESVHAYETTAHVHKSECPGSRGEGRSPGIKLVCPVVRAAGLDHEAFVTHWLQRHAPLALVHHPGMCRYVANVVQRRLTPTAPEWDGISELHFASPEDLENRMYDSPDGKRIIGEDVARFIGRGIAYRAVAYVLKKG